MNFHEKRKLGRTNLEVGRLGLSSSFGAPASAFEEAFERGCNYWTWGTFIRGRSEEMRTAIQNVIKSGKRDELALAVFAYSHSALFTDRSIENALKKLGTDRIDILLLGYFSSRPPQRVIDGALSLKERGLIRHIGISGHKRTLFATLESEKIIDVVHFRYNAANSGAEQDVFPHFDNADRPGFVSFTATRWRQLLNANKMPPGEKPLAASECYRFALSHPSVDVCMMGAKNSEQMRENLATLDRGPLSDEEMLRVRKIGDFVYGRKQVND